MSVRCQCWLEGDDLTLYGPTADIGVGGLFLRTAVPVAQGLQVDILLRVSSEATAISARALVTRTVPVRTNARCGARYGVGVEFMEFHKGEQTLSTLLSSSTPLPWL